MDTEWICFDAVTGYDKGELNHAAQILRQGGLVAFPTETVYGLGGDGFNPQAAKKIYEANIPKKSLRITQHILPINENFV